jgi:hypothetical protein
MKLDPKRLTKWLEDKIKAHTPPTGRGNAYDDSVAPLVQQTYQSVLEFVKANTALSLADLKPGDYFRFADGKEKEVVFQRGHGDQIIELNRNVGEYFEVENEDLTRPVARLQATFEDVK